MNDKLGSFMGITKKAGKLKTGHDEVLNLVKGKKCKLVIFTKDYSTKQAKDIQTICKQNNIKEYTLKYTMEDLAFLTKKLNGVFAVIEERFSNKIQEIIKENNLSDKITQTQAL